MSADPGKTLSAGSRPAAASLHDFIKMESERILSSCTRCGRCFDVCPMTKYMAMDPETAAGPDVVGGILAVLRNESGTGEALAWTRVCMASAECVPACPENVNPMLMVRLARIVAAGGTGREPQIRMADDLAHFPRMKAFAQMQLSAAEVAEWL